MGNFSPRSFAQAIAISYPASACLITPVPGSFHSTRANRLSASLLPSQTITTPECWEYPKPTPRHDAWLTQSRHPQHSTSR